MDYAASPQLPITENAERRRTTRKPLKVSALIGTAEFGILQGHTIDISTHGLSIMLSAPLDPGALCSIRFQVNANGIQLGVLGAGKVTNCSCSGMGGFRIGLKFKIKDQGIQDSLYEFLQLHSTPPSN